MKRLTTRPPGGLRWLLAVVALLLVGAGALALALRLDGKATAGTLYDQDSPGARATADYHRQFGQEPIEILVRASREDGGLPALLLTQDISRILGLEGCLSGNQPRKAKSPAPACAELARTKPVHVVYGPGTFINESARQVAARLSNARSRGLVQANRAAEAARKVAAAQGRSPAEQDRLAAQARTLALAQSYQDALGIALRYGLPRVPQLNDPDFVLRLVFEPSLGFDSPKPRFAYLFPGRTSALIQVRLRDGLSESQRRRATALVRQAVASRPFRLERGRYVVSGEPVVSEAVASALPDSLWPPLVGGVVAAALALLLVSPLRPRALRLAPLVAALAALGLALAAVSVFGGSLTLASVAIAPVLVGFAAAGFVLHQRLGPAGTNAPLLLVAAGTMVMGFLALVASPVPMVRAFGAAVSLGLGVSFALTAPLGAALRARSRPGRPNASRARDAGARAAGAVVRAATGRPQHVLAVALMLALLGWLVSVRGDVEATIERLAPADIEAVGNARTLERQTGSAGTVTVVAGSERLTSPPVLRWMSEYQRRVLALNRFSDQRPCRSADLCPALSLTSLVGSARTERQVRRALRRLPPYFARSVISPDRKTGAMSFVVGSMPLDDQRRLIDGMRSELDPPPGVTARVTGLPVLAADTATQLRVNWIALALIVLAAVVLAMVALRTRLEALPRLEPAVLATGWSALALFALPFPANPMSAGLAAVVVAVSAVLCVTLSARYEGRRSDGLAAGPALEHAMEPLGPLSAAALPALGGMAVLAISDVPMLQDFALASLVEVPLALIGTAIVLPAALVWTERRGRLPVPRSAAELKAAVGAAGAAAMAGLRKAGRGLRRGIRGAPGAASRALPAAIRALRALPRAPGAVFRSVRAAGRRVRAAARGRRPRLRRRRSEAP